MSLINSLINSSVFRRPPASQPDSPPSPPSLSHLLTQLCPCFLFNYFIGSDRSSRSKVISIQPSIFQFLIQVIFYSFDRDRIHSVASQWESQPRCHFRLNFLHLLGTRTRMKSQVEVVPPPSPPPPPLLVLDVPQKSTSLTFARNAPAVSFN